MDMSKPIAEILVEGELSPFEHEALYRILKKHFRLEQPTYSDLIDETVGTRVNIVFHHPYELSFFANSAPQLVPKSVERDCSTKPVFDPFGGSRFRDTEYALGAGHVKATRYLPGEGGEFVPALSILV